MSVTLFLLAMLTGWTAAEVCQLRDYGNGGHVCVCNSTHCDTIPRPTPVDSPNYIVYTSNKAGLRFNQSSGAFATTNEIYKNQIVINSKEKYQNIIGWGGAFTDAAGINIKSLSEDAQKKLMNSYFSPNGIEYSLGRVPIGGTDFSTHGYSYDDGPSDPALTNFKLASEDFQYKIPLIKEALALTNGNIQFFASPWTAPKWMKTNNEYYGFGFIKSDMYQAWADYFVRFLDEYRQHGIEFWGITTGNEPSLSVAFSKINTVGWTPSGKQSWIQHNLGPTIRKSNYSNIKIMDLDDQRLFLPWLTNIILGNEFVRKYVDGIAVHWYWDDLVPANVLTKTHQNFPDKFILYTEACVGDKPYEKGVDLGSWERGERYSANIIENLSNWIEGWTDWNMVLDLTGGPTYIDNNVDSPIIVNATADEFYKQPMFYNLGHFSKFVPRGSRRIGSSSFDVDIPVAAFQSPDNATVAVILNKKEDAVSVAILDDSKGTTQITLSGKSITTIMYW